MQIGIVGNGYVGGATALLGNGSSIKTFIYDSDPDKCSPLSIRLKELASCDLIFVCVPTPMEEDGSCHFNVVESVVSELLDYLVPARRIVVRSTVPVGTCETLGVSFMPEFLTESNWREDVTRNKNWIFGYDPPDWINWTRQDRVASDFLKLAKLSGKDVTILTTKEAELVKLARNSFLATKVGFFNEIKDFCEENNIDYEAVRSTTVADKRIGDSHTYVPGPDGKKGFGGTCLPKDINSLLFQFHEASTLSPILEAVKSRNEKIDRPEKDWKNNKGRAAV